MQFVYSVELPASQHNTGKLAGQVAVRQSRYGSSEVQGALRAQKDWKSLVGPLNDFNGSLASKYGLMQVAVPECLPERLEVIAYASELGFLYDDWTEFVDAKSLQDANDELRDAFEDGLRDEVIATAAGGIKAMQARLFGEMIAIDKPRALRAIQAWNEFLDKAAGRQHQETFRSLDAYLRYRVLDVGEMFWFGLMTFGMGLTIPDEDVAQLRALTWPCWIVLALQNDICSYEKEAEAARRKESDEERMVNALTVLMNIDGMHLEGAKQMCTCLIDDNLSKYMENLAQAREEDTLCKDAVVYAEALLYTISGDAAWSLIAPRYGGRGK